MPADNPLAALFDDGRVLTLGAVAGLATLGYMRIRKGSAAMVPKYTALHKAQERYRYKPGFSRGKVVRKLRDGWLISFVDNTGKTRHTVAGGSEAHTGQVMMRFRAPTSKEMKR